MMAKGYILGASAARKVSDLIKRTATSSRTGSAGALVSANDFPLPYTVKWAQSVGESGSWIIYLGGGSSLLYYGDEWHDPSAGMTAAGGDYPAGWFVVPTEGSSASFVQLLIPDGSVSSSGLKIVARNGSTPSGYEYSSPVIADIAGNKSVKQYVSSAICMVGGSSKVKGNTDDSVEIAINGAKIASGSDSNVKVKTSMVSGVPTLTIDVYYK